MPEATTPPADAEKFVDEVESGDRLRGLLALRALLAERLADGVPARDLAALTRRLMQVMEELEALGADPEKDSVDELARKRQAALAEAASQ